MLDIGSAPLGALNSATTIINDIAFDLADGDECACIASCVFNQCVVSHLPEREREKYRERETSVLIDLCTYALECSNIFSGISSKNSAYQENELQPLLTQLMRKFICLVKRLIMKTFKNTS